jgi:hypothetical protein
MAKDGGRPWAVLAVAVAVAAAIPVLASGLVPAAPAGAAPRKGTTLPEAARLAQAGHTAFWHCPARTTELLVAVDTLTLQPGASLDISFSVRNGGTSSCTYTAPDADAASGRTPAALTAGPCGSVGYEIDDAHHHNVWPGTQVVNCPALGSAQLAPGASVSGTATWDQTRPDSAHRVPPGPYVLVVENGRFTFPLRVARS